jgi:membrane-bound metal-dependent hydrolase YbcI (DUF457 family)
VIIFNWAIHLIISLFFSIEFATQPIDIFFIMIGSLLPDIDHPRSMFGRLNIFTSLMTHRGFCHSLIGCALLSLPFLYIHGAAPYVFLGAVSHLFGDSLQSAAGSRKFKVKIW